MNNPLLPVLISVPHGGSVIPEHLAERLLLTDVEVALDGDTWTKDLFDFRGRVQTFITADTARVVIDLNRDPTDRPPANPDGIVKTLTVAGEQVWSRELSDEETNELIESIHAPYHQQLMHASGEEGLHFALDCHTMLDIGPSKSGTAWEQRPLICISNRGSAGGGKESETITAPPEFMQLLKQELEQEFADEAVEGVPLVMVNAPFKGGYITQLHGPRTEIPWVQLELNRRLYLPGEPGALPSAADRKRLGELRDKLLRVMERTAAPVQPEVGEEPAS
ncbi:N-formylglutamate amidohydrolase [Alkalicoccus luteus]|uniref:N-formylglutamate amidohydrolase n=1 Tax=Alkalicoccus luteus TaxID=1237094 RepID=A0A969TXN7_9BACI|nr:N-formylglutamate amidohydrolase [Alkalicoccus luteus]NJP38394.1 N-formylglutamate amidohydrolase [Alkalicoccus luteus]